MNINFPQSLQVFSTVPLPSRYVFRIFEVGETPWACGQRSLVPLHFNIWSCLMLQSGTHVIKQLGSSNIYLYYDNFASLRYITYCYRFVHNWLTFELHHLPEYLSAAETPEVFRAIFWSCYKCSSTIHPFPFLPQTFLVYFICAKLMFIWGSTSYFDDRTQNPITVDYKSTLCSWIGKVGNGGVLRAIK